MTRYEESDRWLWRGGIPRSPLFPPQQVPSFPVALVLMSLPMGPQVDGPLERGRDARWKDVPDIFWRDVNGKKVYLRSRVVPATIVSAGGANVSEAIGMLMDGALDLNPQELPPVFNPDVVALGVAPGPGNVQPMFGGAGHKLQFCPLPAFFVVLYVSSLIGH